MRLQAVMQSTVLVAARSAALAATRTAAWARATPDGVAAVESVAWPSPGQTRTCRSRCARGSELRLSVLSSSAVALVAVRDRRLVRPVELIAAAASRARSSSPGPLSRVPGGARRSCHLARPAQLAAATPRPSRIPARAPRRHPRLRHVEPARATTKPGPHVSLVHPRGRGGEGVTTS